MTFDRRMAKVPISVGNIAVQLKDWPASVDGLGKPILAGQSIMASIDVMYSDGTRDQIHVSLAPHLTGAQIADLQSFLATLRVKAQAELLPVS